MKRFEVGKRYGMCWVGDADFVSWYDVIARTEATVTLRELDGKKIVRRVNRKLSRYSGCETVLPHGSYSMAPLLRADFDLERYMRRCH